MDPAVLTVRATGVRRSVEDAELIAGVRVLVGQVRERVLSRRGLDQGESRRKVAPGARAVDRAVRASADAELAVALGFSAWEAGLLVTAAMAPGDLFAIVDAALRRGETTWVWVRKFYLDTASLSQEERLLVAVTLFGTDQDLAAADRLDPDGNLHGRPWSVPLYRAALAAEITACRGTDVASERMARARAYAARRMSVQVHDNGMATLQITGPAPAVVAAGNRLDRAARGVRALGDERTLDQLQVDVGLGLLVYAVVVLGAKPEVGCDDDSTTDDTAPGDKAGEARAGDASVVDDETHDHGGTHCGHDGQADVTNDDDRDDDHRDDDHRQDAGRDGCTDLEGEATGDSRSAGTSPSEDRSNGGEDTDERGHRSAHGGGHESQISDDTSSDRRPGHADAGDAGDGDRHEDVAAENGSRGCGDSEGQGVLFDEVLAPDDLELLARVVNAVPPVALQVVVPYSSLSGGFPICAHCCGTLDARHPHPRAPGEDSAQKPGEDHAQRAEPVDDDLGREPAHRRRDPHSQGPGEGSAPGPSGPPDWARFDPDPHVSDGTGDAGRSDTGPGPRAPAAPGDGPSADGTGGARDRDRTRRRGRRGRVAEVLGPHPFFITDGQARELALLAGTTLHRLIADLRDGRLVERTIKAYKPDAQMRRQVIAADVYSRAPGERVGAHAGELDHVTPHGWAGGQTSEINLALLAKGPHRSKTDGDLLVTMGARRDLTFTTLLGQVVQTRAHDYRTYLERPRPDDSDDRRDLAGRLLQAVLADQPGARTHGRSRGDWLTLDHVDPVTGRVRPGPHPYQPTLDDLLGPGTRSDEESDEAPEA